MNATDTAAEILKELDFREKRPCEIPEHELGRFGHADGNEQFVKVVHPCGCKQTRVLVICASGIVWGFRCGRAICTVCAAVFPADECWTLLGPANQGDTT